MDKLSWRQVLRVSPAPGFHFLVQMNGWVHTSGCFGAPRALFPRLHRHLAAVPVPTASLLRAQLLPRCLCLFLPGHLRHILNYVPIIQGDLGHLMCHVMLHNYIPDPGFQHLKSSKPG